MRNVPHFMLVLALIAGAVACSTVSSDSAGDAADSKMTIPSGTRLRITLIDGVSSTKSVPGDEFLASLAEPVIVDGKLALESGT
ncbi:MAG: hypothetical protein L0Z53_26620, partial [Acidobacteriales bacterium]|nr:hypothetical protein [Terriglobales bacterium]